MPGGQFKIDDFFYKNSLSVCRDSFGFEWIMNSLKYFKEFIPSENYNLDNYFNSGVLAYQSEFLPKLEEMLKYMEQNHKIINSIYLVNKLVR